MKDYSKLLQDFYEFVIETDHGMEWAGATTDSGHGFMSESRSGGLTRYAHRLSYIIEFGSIPDDLEVDHDPACPKTCVTPEHLTLRTKPQHSRIGWERGELNGGWGTKRVRIHEPKPPAFFWQIEMSCPRCGELFLPNTAKQKYCSEICMRQDKEERRKRVRYPRPDTKICEQCGDEFTPKRADTTLCSRACIDADQNAKRKDRGKFLKVCANPECMKEFTHNLERVQCCSKSCSTSLRHQRKEG